MESSFQSAIRTTAVDVLQHLVGVDEEGGVAPATGLMGQSLSKMSLPHTGRTADQGISLLADPGTGREVQDLLPVDAGVEVEVKPFQRLSRVDGCPPDAELELFLSAPFHFILQQPRQELDVGPLALNGLLVPHI